MNEMDRVYLSAHSSFVDENDREIDHLARIDRVSRKFEQEEQERSTSLIRFAPDPKAVPQNTSAVASKLGYKRCSSANKRFQDLLYFSVFNSVKSTSAHLTRQKGRESYRVLQLALESVSPWLL